MNYEQIKETLESMVDTRSLQTVLEALCDVCMDKAEHLETNWQDKQSARVWILAGEAINNIDTKGI